MQALYNVVQFFPDSTFEYLARTVPLGDAVSRFFEAQHSIGARYGLVARVIITDTQDHTCAEWIIGKGLTFPQTETTDQASRADAGTVRE